MVSLSAQPLQPACPSVIMGAITAAAAQESVTAAVTGGTPSGGTSGSGVSGAGGITDTAGAAVQYSTLYARRAQLEVQMRSLDTLRLKISAILNGPLQEVAAILAEGTHRCLMAFTANSTIRRTSPRWQNLTVGLGLENPRVIQAQGVLKIARDRFVNQMKAVLNGHTSDQMRRDVMTTEYETLNKQIKDQEKTFHDSRELSTQLTLRTNEVALRLKILETAMQSAEQLKITTVSAQNRLAVVDTGIPAERSRPGLLLIGVVSLAIPLFIGSLLLLIDEKVIRERGTAHGRCGPGWRIATIIPAANCDSVRTEGRYGPFQ